MEGRSECCFSMKGLTVRVLNNFGNSCPRSFSGWQSGTLSRGSCGRKPCWEEIPKSSSDRGWKVDLIRGLADRVIGA